MKSLRALKYTLLTLTAVAALCFVLLCGTVLIERMAMKKDVATIFGYSTISIKDGSGSMAPTLMPGDTVLLKKQKSYAVGDVITFYDDIGLNTHRIVEITDEGYRTKGDNIAQSVDAGVRTNEDIVGKMISDGAMNGFQIFMLSQWSVLQITVIFGAGYWIVSEVESRAGDKSAKNCKGKE